MAKKKTAKKMGRPSKDLTKEEIVKIEQYATICCSWDDIATMIGWNSGTLQKKELAKEAYQTGMAKCRVSLRRKQFAVAMKGNVPLLMFLGRVLLGQKEAPTIQVNTDGAAHVSIGPYVEKK